MKFIMNIKYLNPVAYWRVNGLDKITTLYLLKKNKLKEPKLTVKSWLKKEDISVILVRKGANIPIYVSHLHPLKPCAVEDILSFDEAY